MSFNVNWNSLESESLRGWTIDILTGALNSGRRPNTLALGISIKDLNFGKVAPNFEILEIGELDKDRFRGIFKITYSGDFHLTLHTQVQANPLKIHSDNSVEREISEENFITPRFLSNDAFNLPLDLKLSDLKILGIGIIVFSKTKGLTLVFRNDPLDSINVSSTFDDVHVLANFLQKQIEHQIRDLFRETLPTLIHQFSLKYTSSLANNDFINNLKDHLKDLAQNPVVDSADFESVAPETISKTAKLYGSRQTLDLRIPGFKRVVQRNHLEKFNKHVSPNLAHSLYSNLKLSVNGAVTQHNNSIPVDLLEKGDFRRKDEILREISTIQSQSFYSGNSGRAKRRTIKLGRKKQNLAKEEIAEETSKTLEPAPLGTEGLASTYISACSSGVGEIPETSTEPEIPIEPQQIFHPTPIKKNPVDRLATSTGRPSPLSHNSSFVGSVGLGNSLFARSAPAISASPLRKEPVPKPKKSLNRIDIEKINHKLQLQLDLQGEKTDKQSIYSEAPPPYYQGVRLGF